MNITPSPTNEYVAILTLTHVNDAEALERECSELNIVNGVLDGVQIEPIMPPCNAAKQQQKKG
jgi:hypothetical protein